MNKDWDVVTFYRDKDDQWRWHRQAPNGRILAHSGEGYHHYFDCVSMAYRVNGRDMAVRYDSSAYDGGSIVASASEVSPHETDDSSSV